MHQQKTCIWQHLKNLHKYQQHAWKIIHKETFVSSSWECLIMFEHNQNKHALNAQNIYRQTKAHDTENQQQKLTIWFIIPFVVQQKDHHQRIWLYNDLMAASCDQLWNWPAHVKWAKCNCNDSSTNTMSTVFSW
jgi:hypothetical protein